MHPESHKNGLAQVFATSNLIHAQSLEILLHNLQFDLQNRENFLKLGSLLEDIGNIYLNISEKISQAYATTDADNSTIVEYQS